MVKAVQDSSAPAIASTTSIRMRQPELYLPSGPFRGSSQKYHTITMWLF